VKGIGSHKGMGMVKGKLFVNNINELVEIDNATTKILKRHDVTGAKFLNDVSMGGDKF